MPLEGSEKSLIGFYVNVWVASRTVRDAEIRALSAIRKHWGDFGYREKTGADPSLLAEEASVLSDRFKPRWRSGFSFYSEE